MNYTRSPDANSEQSFNFLPGHQDHIAQDIFLKKNHSMEVANLAKED
jgi:hypothetical protein